MLRDININDILNVVVTSIRQAFDWFNGIVWLDGRSPLGAFVFAMIGICLCYRFILSPIFGGRAMSDIVPRRRHNSNNKREG